MNPTYLCSVSIYCKIGDTLFNASRKVSLNHVPKVGMSYEFHGMEHAPAKVVYVKYREKDNLFQVDLGCESSGAVGLKPYVLIQASREDMERHGFKFDPH